MVRWGDRGDEEPSGGQRQQQPWSILRDVQAQGVKPAAPTGLGSPQCHGPVPARLALGTQ